MISLAELISEYAILQSLSSFISTLDLYHLASTCKTIHSFVLFSQTIFNVLRRDCLCDGHGLAERQAFRGLYTLVDRSYLFGKGIQRYAFEEEPIEVRLYNLKCDEIAAPSCCKCGVNVCEECRYYPREQSDDTNRRPHLCPSYESMNVMCLCSKCDPILEDKLKGRFLNELCDCDIYMRWICSKCVKDEQKFTEDYYENHTEHDGFSGTKRMLDHQGDRDFYCTCGNIVPQDMRPRCTFCRRRHLPENEWFREMEEVEALDAQTREGPLL